MTDQRMGQARTIDRSAGPEAVVEAIEDAVRDRVTLNITEGGRHVGQIATPGPVREDAEPLTDEDRLRTWLDRSQLARIASEDWQGLLGLLAEVRAEEREACAQMFEQPLAWLCLDHGGEEVETIAHAIRNRTTNPKEGT